MGRERAQCAGIAAQGPTLMINVTVSDRSQPRKPRAGQSRHFRQLTNIRRHDLIENRLNSNSLKKKYELRILTLTRLARCLHAFGCVNFTQDSPPNGENSLRTRRVPPTPIRRRAPVDAVAMYRYPGPTAPQGCLDHPPSQNPSCPGPDISQNQRASSKPRGAGRAFEVLRHSQRNLESRRGLWRTRSPR